MKNVIYCVFNGDDHGFVEGLFDNLEAAEECYKFHSEFSPLTCLVDIDTQQIASEFIEPDYD